MDRGSEICKDDVMDNVMYGWCHGRTGMVYGLWHGKKE